MTLPPDGTADEPSRTRRTVVEAALAGTVVALGHLLLRLSGAFLVGALNDDGVYVVLGKAIAEGDGYRSIHLVGAPLHLRYPPGFPLLLALPWALGGTLGAVRATVAVLQPLVAGAAAGLVWWIGRRRLELSPAPLAICAVAPFLLDPAIQYDNIPLTEPYLVLGWAAVLALTPPLVAPAPQITGAVPWTRAIALGLLLAATVLFRTVAVALIPALLVALALHGRWKEAAACAAALLAPLVVWEALRAHWMARGPLSSQPDDLSYWRWLGVHGPLALVGYAARTAAANGVEYVRKLAGYLFSSQPLGIGVVLAGAAAAAVACVRSWRSPLVWTTLGVAALTFVWPFAQGRLLLPLLPFLGLLVAGTLEAGLRRAPPRLKWVVPAALGLVAVFVTLRQIELRHVALRSFASGVLPPPKDLSPTLTLAVRTRFIYQTAAWVRSHTAPLDRVMVDAPAAMYLYTGRRTVPASPTESRLNASAFAVPGGYLAGRILADSVSVVIWAPPAPELERDILTIQGRCRDVLQRDSSTSVIGFHVRRDEGCLRERVLAAATPVPPARP